MHILNYKLQLKCLFLCFFFLHFSYNFDTFLNVADCGFSSNLFVFLRLRQQQMDVTMITSKIAATRGNPIVRPSLS